MGVLSERGGLERDLVGARFLRLSGIQGCLTRDAQFHFRQGISADCFRGNGTAQVDEEDPVTDGNRVSREDTLQRFRTRDLHWDWIGRDFEEFHFEKLLYARAERRIVVPGNLL